MADFKILITAQYYENKAVECEDWDGVTESWKAKGGEQFSVDISADQRFHLAENELKSLLTSLMNERSTLVDRYELVDYEFIDGVITDLTDNFEVLLEGFYNAIV